MRQFCSVLILFLPLLLNAQDFRIGYEGCGSKQHMNGDHVHEKTNTVLSLSSLKVDSAHLFLSVFNASDSIRGELHFTYSSTDSIPIALAGEMRIDSISVDGFFFAPTRQGELYWIEESIAQKSVVIFFSGSPPTSRSVNWGEVSSGPAFYTLSQPYGGKEWWPQVAASDVFFYRNLTIDVESADTLLGASNGRLIGTSVHNGRRTSRWQFDYSIYNYLVAVAVGPYTLFQDTLLVNGLQGNTFEVPYFNLFFESEADSLYNLTNRAAPIFDLFHKYLPDYPFYTYGHTQWVRGGGMEHSGNSFMGNMNDDLIAHELAHQWFGDLVAIESYRDIWLNEGFATFFTGLIFEEIFTEWADDWRRHYQNLVASDSDGSVYVLEPDSVSRIFDRRLTYGKGGMVLVTLRQEVGEEDFYRGIRSYIQKYRLDNDSTKHFAETTTDKFFDEIEATCMCDLSYFEDQWVYGQGYPTYEIRWEPNERGIRYTLTQETSHSSVPVFQNKVLMRIYGEGRSEDYLIQPSSNPYSASLFTSIRKVDSVAMDPDMAVVTGVNTSKRVTFEPLSVFPNPASDQIQVLWNQSKGFKANFRLLGTSGNEVMRWEAQDYSDVLVVDKLPSGAYVLQAFFIDGSSEQVSVIIAH